MGEADTVKWKVDWENREHRITNIEYFRRHFYCDFPYIITPLKIWKPIAIVF